MNVCETMVPIRTPPPAPKTADGRPQSNNGPGSTSFLLEEGPQIRTSKPFILLTEAKRPTTMCLGRVPRSRRMTCSLLLPSTGAGKESLLLDRTKAGTKNLVEEEDQTELPVQDAVAFTKPRLSMQPANNDDDANTTTRTSRTCSLSTTDEESSVDDDSSSSLTSLSSILKTEESASNHQNQTHEKTVRFGHIHTRSFDIRMGDTTNCSCLTRGPPLVLSNSYVDRPPRRVSSFDAHCGKADPLSAEERRTLLIENFGYTLREILNAEHDIDVARHLEHKHRHSHKMTIPQVKLVAGIKKKLAAARAG